MILKLILLLLSLTLSSLVECQLPGLPPFLRGLDPTQFLPTAGPTTPPSPTRIPTRAPTKSGAANLVNDSNSQPSTLPYKSYYVQFAYPSLQNDIKSQVNETVLTTLLNSDDSPFLHYHLPKPMVVFNKRIFDVFIGPNGNVHLSKHQPCDTYNLFGDSSCHLNNSYYACFGFITDLYPRGSTRTKNIVVFNTSNAITIAYRDIVYYGSRLATSFRISIYDDHHLEIAMDKLQRSSFFPLRDLTVLGLRPPKDDPTTIVTSTDMLRGLTDWKTKVPGIYPSNDYFQAGYKYFFCPITAQWCAQPNTFNYTHYTQVITKFSFSNLPQRKSFFDVILSTISLSCQDDITLSLLPTFASNISPEGQVITNSTILLPCDILDSTKIRCNLQHVNITNYLDQKLLATSNVQNELLYFWLVWKPAKQWPNITYTTEVFPFDPIQLTFYNSKDKAIVLPSNNNTCTDAAVCSQNFTCVQEAQCYRPSIVDSLFSNPTCIGKCYEDYNSYQQYEDYTRDSKGRCCLIQDLDCGGYCFGNNTVALNNVDRSTYCCPAGSRIDCAGICEGSTKYDACNVCGGTDLTGVTCFNFSLISFKTTGNDGKHFYPTYDLQATTLSALYYRNESITVINQSPSEIVFSLSIASEPLFAPSVTFPRQATTLKSNTRITLPVFISMEDLLNDSNLEKKWKVKQLVLTFYRSEYTSAKFTRTFSIYPLVQNCDIIPDADTCMALPGCIYCLVHPGMLLLDSVGSDHFKRTSEVYRRRKLLLGNVQEEEGDVNDAEESSISRKLFNNFIPNVYENDANKFTGRCVDGWLQEDCKNKPAVRALLAASTASSHRMSSLVLSTALSTMMCFFLLWRIV